MEAWRRELAIKFIDSLKDHWVKNNAHVNMILKYIKDYYEEEPRADHFAIRSISGIGFGPEEALRLFSSLGFRYGGSWWIPELKISACHFEPPRPCPGQASLEKIFFSTVLVEEFRHELSAKDYRKLLRILSRNTFGVVTKADDIAINFENWAKLNENSKIETWDKLLNFFTSPPWAGISYNDFNWISEKKQLQVITHVLAHGFQPNHFTYLMKDPDYSISNYVSMKYLSRQIQNLGIPMQEEIEGDEDSILCQTSTIARPSIVKIINQKTEHEIEWPMSYVEFIRRGKDPSSPTGRYEGFLSNQAKVLFGMTAVKSDPIK